MTRHHISFNDAANLLERLGPIRYIDPATGIDEFFYLKQIREFIPLPPDDEDEYPGYVYEEAEYVRLTYPVPGPEGDEMGRIRIEESGSSKIQLTIERDAPFKREQNYHWKQVCLFFERYKQLLDQFPSIDITVSAPTPLPRPHLQVSPPVLHLLTNADAGGLHAATDSTTAPTAGYRETTQVIFYGTPAEFSLVITACAHSLTQRQGNVLFEMRSIVTPDIPLLEVWIRQQTIAGTILGSMLVQRLPGSRSRLSVLAAEAQYVALRDVWCLVRDELVQQGWIDALGAELIDHPETQPGRDMHLEQRATDDPTSRRENDHWAYKRAKRKQIVTEYRAARQRGEVANKDGWASKHGISGRTLLKYEKEFPEQAE
jgi:hypothetical protein